MRVPLNAGLLSCLAGALLIALCAAPAPALAAGMLGPRLPETSDLLLVRTAGIQTTGVLSLSAAAEYYDSNDISYFLGLDSPAHYTTFDLGARYGLLPWLEVSALVPFHRVAWDGSDSGSGDVTGMGEPEVGLKAGLPFLSGPVSLAAVGHAMLPVGERLEVSDAAGDALSLTGGDDADWDVMAVATLDLTQRFPLRLHANVGWASHSDGGRRFFPDYYPAVPENGDSWDNDAVILRGAVEFPGKSVDLFSEFRGDLIRDEKLVAPKENPLTVTPGIRMRFSNGWFVTGAVSLSISGDDRSTPDFDPHDAYPDWGATVSVSYAWPVFAADTDADGIPDFRDQCPREPEDLDGFHDDDGCPDPDNDADGVPDAFDGRPLLMEDYDGFEDYDGVPDLDNDGDGIIDERDMCPDQPEDLDGFEDGDGCPDE
jgi:hypothetical protein